MKNNHVALELGTLPEYKSAEPYKTSLPLVLLKVVLLISTGGLFGLVLLWNFKSRFWFYKKCDIIEADKFLICTKHEDWLSVQVEDFNGTKYFQYNGLRYVFNGQNYVLPLSLCSSWTHAQLLDMSRGLCTKDINDEILACEGKNVIDVPILNLPEDIAQELFRPDYIYIYLCCILWFIHDYATFSGIILATATLGGIWDIWNRRKNRTHIRHMARYVIDVRVFRNQKWKTITSDNLLPGDAIEIPVGGWKAPCDLALISGSAIVDESSLTGESLPVVKLKPGEHPQKLYNAEKDKKFTIYGGTTVIGVTSSGNNNISEVDTRSIGVVVRTGWKTAKGNLIRSILSVSQQEYVYEKDARIFLGMLSMIGIGLFFVALWLFGVFQPGEQFSSHYLLYGFELIAILVPPMLPTLFQVGLVLSASILQNQYEVFTTDSSRIPLSGKIDIMCFDKTGTLTKDDLDMIGVVWHNGKTFSDVHPVSSISSSEFMRSLVCCHELSELHPDLVRRGSKQNTVSRYSGPTVDMQIFESTGWEYHDGDGTNTFSNVVCPKSGKRMEIIKRFDFDPAVQRMSVIARDPKDKRLLVYCKGSPEIIRECCNPSSLPKNYIQETKKHSRNGCYVLAVASQSNPVFDMDLSNVKRSDVEKNLNFLGFILLRNELKPDTEDAIRQLKQGRVKMSILTGDNIYTAFYIAQKCGIISAKKKWFIGDMENGSVHFYEAQNTKQVLDISNYSATDKNGITVQLSKRDVAIGITADAWEFLKGKGHEDFMINDVKIYARMKPLQKEAVVKMIRAADHIVGMCGDGANDCAALSAAHCGVALSEAEASVVSPFTAKRLSIQSVVDLVREARACLANSFAVFKYTIIYGITQTTQALFCYWYGGDLSEYQYIMIDFLIFLPTTFFISKSQSSQHLLANPPTSRVFGPRTLSSMFGVVVIMIFSIFIAHVILHQQSWYTPSVRSTHTWYSIPEVTVTWFVGSFTYAAAAITCSMGGRWRKPFFYNIGLMLCVTFAFVSLNVLLWLFPEWDAGDIYGFMQLCFLPVTFRGIIFGIGLGSVTLQLIWEYVFVNKIGDLMGEKYGIGRGPVDDDVPMRPIGVADDSSEEVEHSSSSGETTL